jgi:hypothetical protein
MVFTKAFVYCVGLFILVQAITWFQLNGQFFSNWFKNNNFLLSLFGVPISYGYIYATKFGFEAFDGNLWPGRLLGFASGMLTFTLFTWMFLKEGINPKSAISLLLASALVCIQIFWKS